MKILWITNKITKAVSLHLGDTSETPSGGWIDGLFESLVKQDELEFSVAFPYSQKMYGITESFSFHGFNRCPMNGMDLTTVTQIEEIIDQENPDVIHIFGTEFTHSYAAVLAAENRGVLDRVVINIQGIMSACAEHYTDALPPKIVNRYTLKDFVSGNTIAHQRDDFTQRGEWEKKTLRKVKNVIGRTAFDKACVTDINPELNYYHCNETLRPAFYSDNWDIEKCERHSVFISQGSYPIKGLHCFIPAAAIIKKKYPDLKVYIAGANMKITGLAARLRAGSYKLYINQLIREYGLEDTVVYTGPLVCPRMKKRYLSSHVFVSPSVLENSPNSVGEAMILGVPVVSSNVGGVSSMLTDGEDGFLYRYDNAQALADCVDKIFSDDALAQKFSQNARAHAAKTHNVENNNQVMLEIYKKISGK